MDEKRLLELLERFRSGELGSGEMLEQLRLLPYEDIGVARLDLHRALRTGAPEAVLGTGKTPGQAAAIVRRMAEHADPVLLTRATAEMAAAVLAAVPDARYHETARCVVVQRARLPLLPGVAVVCAGTADIPVAEEAALTAELHGSGAERIFDVGVAGIHRLLDQVPLLRQMRAVVVAAGMEGALASVVGGLVRAPVIAVPTSVGYGASFGGLAALLAMLNSCAAGVAVVNIDNGFGAGYLAAMINRLGAEVRE